MNSAQKDLISNYPKAIEPHIEGIMPNRSIPLYKGEFEARCGEEIITIEGQIEYNWIPSNRVRFRGTYKGVPIKIFSKARYQLYVKSEDIGTALFTHYSLGENAEIKGIVNSPMVIGDRSIKSDHYLFGVPNFIETFGETIVRKKSNEITSSVHGRISLSIENKYSIEIDPSNTIEQDLEKLQDYGGYTITHWGRLKSNHPTGYDEIRKIIEALSVFLSFINGRRINIQFLRSMYDGSELWTDYTAYRSSPYKSVRIWSGLKSYENYQPMWDKFYELWQEENNKDFINTLIYWYLLVNTNSGEGEGSLVMAQAALELIYNWLLIEKEKLIVGKDADSIKASNKIRLILNRLNLQYDIPEGLPNLINYCQQDDDYCDGPEAIVRLRNAIVHGNEKKRDLIRKIDSNVLFEALDLSTWYMELSLLFVLNFQGKYQNRCSGNHWKSEGEYVPWVNPT